LPRECLHHYSPLLVDLDDPNRRSAAEFCFETAVVSPDAPRCYALKKRVTDRGRIKL
jgi:hypothetical protein